MCLLALALADSWEDTLDHYQAKLRGDPQNQFANSIVGILSFRLNKISEAAAPLHRAVQLDENDWVAAQHLGLS